VIRFALLLAIYPSYLHSRRLAELLFWLSPLLDPLAVWRIILSATSRPKQWRGRAY
jgi:dolichol-phosphate mannosyltransferase